MGERIRYDDNMYFLTVMVHNLNDAIRLNVDAEYFAEKILEDTFFINKTIQKLYKVLNDSSRLVQRKNYLHTMLKLKRLYSKLIDEMLGLEGAYAVIFQSVLSELRRIASDQMEDISAIRDKLGELETGSLDTSLISYDELNVLMSPLEENPSASGQGR